MPSDEHEAVLSRLRDVPDVEGFLQKVFPTVPLMGAYKPDFLVYLYNPVRKLAIIGEVETSNYTGKDLLGACLLADHTAERSLCEERPSLVIVLPDEAKPGDLSHVEERLNIASTRVRTIRILPAMKESVFIAWFMDYWVGVLQRGAACANGFRTDDPF